MNKFIANKTHRTAVKRGNPGKATGDIFSSRARPPRDHLFTAFGPGVRLTT